MRRKLMFATAIVVAMVSSTVGAVGADGRWESQVTGGVMATAGGTDFYVDLSSRIDAEGNVKGQVQYTRADLAFHVAVDCVYVAPDGRVAVSGPSRIQVGSFSEYVAVAINADGTAVRVYGVEAGDSDCGLTDSFPGLVVDGSFNIRL